MKRNLRACMQSRACITRLSTLTLPTRPAPSVSSRPRHLRIYTYRHFM